jgi:hypothetical protein
MSDFVLVNLSKQQEYVTNHIEGWTIAEVVNWMRQYGTVTEPKNGNPLIYVFESNIGFKDAFQFTENGTLVVLSSGWFA